MKKKMIVPSIHKLMMPALVILFNSASSQITLEESVLSACSSDQYFDSTALKCSVCPDPLVPQADRKCLLSSHFQLLW